MADERLVLLPDASDLLPLRGRDANDALRLRGDRLLRSSFVVLWSVSSHTEREWLVRVRVSALLSTRANRSGMQQ